ncbi:hypothetical protein ES319_A03G093300v1 [Gossypium barbadense]|uniref:Protein DCL, chloroplastic n=2 Tax=Gossypium TaxID=3633 RepID=A0A5J5WCI3_GOSBA|nr:hypothetical protein ES319_A03G093300v1 [Gossypium barbadense]TYH24587.1 hypothetical protein ES288_A03G103300v1 [Gossypium darwinii]
MASFLKPSPSNFHLTFIPISFSSSSVILSSPLYQTTSLRVRFCALTTDPDGGRTASQESSGADLLRKPSIVPDEESGGISEEEDGSKEKGNRGEWIDWEDRILRDTVPLVGFVRMILHSEKYGSGDRLSPEHEKSILERLLPYHPESEKKIGCGIDYITGFKLRSRSRFRSHCVYRGCGHNGCYCGHCRYRGREFYITYCVLRV